MSYHFCNPQDKNTENGPKKCVRMLFRVIANKIGESSEVVGDPGIEPGVSRLEGVTVPCHTLRPVAQTLLWGWIICPAGGVNGQMNMG